MHRGNSLYSAIVFFLNECFGSLFVLLKCALEKKCVSESFYFLLY